MQETDRQSRETDKGDVRVTRGINGYRKLKDRDSGSNKAICRKGINLSVKGTCYHTTDSYPRICKTAQTQVGHSQSLTSNLWSCQRSQSPCKQTQPTYAAALWSEWERLQGRSPLMWLERALSRARSRRSLACSCLGLRGSSSLITRSDLTIKRKRNMHISTEINHLGNEYSKGVNGVECIMRRGYIAICLNEIEYLISSSLNVQSFIHSSTSYSPQIDLT